MNMIALQDRVENVWEERDNITPATIGEQRTAIEDCLSLLDSGSLRVAEKTDGVWSVNEWCKKAVLLSFRLNNMSIQSGGPANAAWWDKVPSKFEGWTEKCFCCPDKGRV